MKTIVVFIAFTFLLFSCTKDRTFENQPINQNDVADPNKSLMINEYLAKGSQFPDEFGVNSDWVEMFNNTDSDINLSSGDYYLTDDFTKPDKFKLTNKTIPAKGFALVYCNSSTEPGTQLNAPFSLSSSGESLAIFAKNQNGEFVVLDSLSFGTQTLDNASTGRFPDASNWWSVMEAPTPGQSNN